MPVPNEATVPLPVLLCQWAIAGGCLGMPVHLHFRGFPSPLMAEMYRRILLWVGDKAVLSIFGMRDFRVLRTEMASLKAVFLFEEKLFEQTAWLLETRPQNGAILSPAPVVILHGNSTVPDDAPSPTLVVHGTSPLQRTLHDWINAEYAFPNLRITEVNPQITFPDELQQLLLTEATERLMEIREQKILRGLIAGSALCHRAEHVDDVVVSWDDYADVRQVLRSVATRPLDDTFDPMALAMVQRANAYMPVRQADIEGQGRPAENEVAGGFYDGFITRREIADLGHTRGSLVRRLVEHLRGLPNGLQIFCSVGTTRSIDPREGWPTLDPQKLAGLLLPWSEKQVRVHFHRLVTAGLITARREAGNQPWRYLLPEAMTNPNSAFSGLPSPGELGVRVPPDPVDGPRQTIVCPTGRANQNQVTAET